MNRRDFLGLLAASAAGFAVDPERALWVPGRKTIFLPPRQPVAVLSFIKGDVITIQGRYAVDALTLRATEHLQQFVVLADVVGPGDVELAVWPPAFERCRLMDAHPLAAVYLRPHPPLACRVVS